MTKSASNTFKPLNGRVLVLPDPPETVTTFGILLPDNKERPATGTVVVGNQDVQEGDRVLFSLFALDEVTIDGVNYAVVADSGILGIYAK